MENPNQPSKPAAPEVNRRAARRMAVRSSAKVECRIGGWGLGPNILVSALDISESGIRAVIKSAVQKGDEVEIILVGARQGRSLKRPAKVAWSRQTEDGNYCVGLRFEKPVPYQDLQFFCRP